MPAADIPQQRACLIIEHPEGSTVYYLNACDRAAFRYTDEFEDILITLKQTGDFENRTTKLASSLNELADKGYLFSAMIYPSVFADELVLESDEEDKHHVFLDNHWTVDSVIRTDMPM